MKIIEVVQGLPEWFSAKCGVPSASNFDKIVTAAGKPSKQCQKYLYRLAGETITGVPEETYQSPAMLRGVEIEASAREMYQFVTGREVKEVGFCIADDGYGCSPDGLVGDDGLIEIKCPIMSTHISYLLANALPVEYKQQLQGQLLVTGRKWCDFVSYYPGLKPLIIRTMRDEAFLKALQIELEVFVNGLKDLIKKIR